MYLRIEVVVVVYFSNGVGGDMDCFQLLGGGARERGKERGGEGEGMGRRKGERGGEGERETEREERRF